MGLLELVSKLYCGARNEHAPSVSLPYVHKREDENDDEDKGMKVKRRKDR